MMAHQKFIEHYWVWISGCCYLLLSHCI